MANSTVRVIIPTNAEELLDLATRVNNKHTELGDASPLKSMVSPNWTDNGSKLATCLEIHRQAESLKRQAEELIAKRNAMLTPIGETVKASRDVLLGIYRETPKALGEFGFDVVDSARGGKAKKADGK